MSWQAVARKDFQDASRSYLLWGLTAFFVFVVTVVSLALGYFAENPTSSDVFGLVHLAFQYLVPLIAISIAHNAIVGEHESGSLKILLSLPHSRDDVIVGKVVGRTGAIVGPLVAGMAIPALGMILVGVRFEAVDFLLYLLFTVMFAVSFVGISVGASALFTTRFRTIVSLFGFYFVFDILWYVINQGSVFVLILVAQKWPSWMPLSAQETLKVFKLISPIGDFDVLKIALYNDALLKQGVQNAPGLQEQVAAVLMLLFWTVGPLALGMWYFQERDL